MDQDTKSIIDPKYAEKLRSPEAKADWLYGFIKTQCYNAEGQLDVEELFNVAEINGIKARDKYEGQVGQKNAVGRLRMTIGNSLRAQARRKHGLYDARGEWHDAEAPYTDLPATHDRNGARLTK